MTSEISARAASLPVSAEEFRAAEKAAALLGGSGRGVGYGKLIVLGEHSVVYGKPAIALPLPQMSMSVTARPTTGESRIVAEFYTGPIDSAPRALTAPITAGRAVLDWLECPDTQFEIAITNTVPVGSGLGSSAASARAIVTAISQSLGVSLSERETYDLIQIAERVAHGNPSGLDAAVTGAQGPIRFVSGKYESFEFDEQVWFVIADTGVHGRTSTAVGAVRQFVSDQPGAGGALIAELGDLTEDAQRTAELGAKMNRAQEILTELGVSNAALDHLIAAARTAGAAGAKLTGGGQGGSMVALAHSARHAEELASALWAAGAAGVWQQRSGPERNA